MIGEYDSLLGGHRWCFRDLFRADKLEQTQVFNILLQCLRLIRLFCPSEFILLRFMLLLLLHQFLQWIAIVCCPLCQSLSSCLTHKGKNCIVIFQFYDRDDIQRDKQIREEKQTVSRGLAHALVPRVFGEAEQSLSVDHYHL
jgi:hypothetical protein